MPLIWDPRCHLQRGSDQWEVTCEGLRRKQARTTTASYDTKEQRDSRAGQKPREALLDNGEGEFPNACQKSGLPAGVPHAHHNRARDPSPRPNRQPTPHECHSQRILPAGGAQPHEHVASSFDNSGHEGQNTVRVSPSSRVLRLRQYGNHNTNQRWSRGPMKLRSHSRALPLRCYQVYRR
jgi:hypothetical protein